MKLMIVAVGQRMPDEASARHWAGQIFQTFAPEADWALFDLGRIEPEALAQRIVESQLLRRPVRTN